MDGQGRLGDVMGTWSPRFHSGIARLVESAVKPPHRITKARGHGGRDLQALALLPRGGNRRGSIFR